MRKWSDMDVHFTAASKAGAAILAAALLTGLPLPRAANAASQTYMQASCASPGGAGANWTNPEWAESSNNAVATASVDGTVTDPLQCLNYGFAIPSTATVVGIEVHVERRSNRTANGGSRDNSLFLVKAGSTVGADRATATAYTTADVVETHGGPADLWGTTWTPAEVNDPAFGAVFTATKPSAAGGAHTVSVDQIQITVHYTTGLSQTQALVNCTSLGGGGANWTRPERAESSNNVYSTASVDGTVTDPLQCLNYGFAIPPTATVVGIEVDVERSSNSTANGGSRDNSLFLVKAGSTVGADRATATAYTTADVVETHGGPADLWGTTWTPAEVNDPAFGAVFTATKPSAAGGAHTVSVDQIRITVYHSYAPSSPILLSPADGATSTTGSPAFDWSDAVDPDGDPVTYEVQADTTAAGAADCGFTSPELNQAGLGVSAFTPGAALADGTYCWRARAVDSFGAASAWSATRNVTINTVGAFNAAETGAANNTTLRTKLVGTAFSFDILALKSGSLFAGYRGSVAVEIVDGSSGGGVCAGMTQLQATGNLTFGAGDNGRKAQAFTYAGAVANARIRLIDASAGVTSCSSDNFTIRPTGISSVTSNMTNAGSTGAPVAKAGDAFTIVAVAGAGYNGTPAIDNGKVTAHAGAVRNGSVSGSFSAGNPATGAASGLSFVYSEVGNFTLGVNGVFDSTFAGGSGDVANGDCIVGSFANTPSGGLYGCNFGNGGATAPIGRFKPDHFLVAPGAALTNRSLLACAPASGFSYMDERFELSFTIRALNAAGNTTQNYEGASWAKLDLTSDAALDIDVLSGAANLTARLDTGIPPGGTFAAGEAALTLGLAFQRLAPDAPDGPHASARVGIAPDDGDPAVGTGTRLAAAALDMDVDNDTVNDHQQIGASTEFRFGRLRILNAVGSEKIGLLVPVRAEYWSGAGFAVNTLDSCTRLNQSNIALDGYAGSVDPGAGNCKTYVKNAPVALASGLGTISFEAPGVSGSLRLTARLGAAGAPPSYCVDAASAPVAAADATLPGLLGRINDGVDPDGDGATAYDDNPAARAAFGVYGAQPRNFIFFRENY